MRTTTISEDLRVVTKTINQLEEEHYTCPITHEIMQDPARDKYGHYYDYSAIASWLINKGSTSPMTRQKLTLDEVHLDRKRKAEIDSFMLFMDHDSSLKEKILIGIFQSIQRAVYILHDQQPLELIAELSEKKLFGKGEIVSFFLKRAHNSAITVKQIVEAHSIVNTLHELSEEYVAFNSFIRVLIRKIFDYCLDNAEKKENHAMVATNLFGLHSGKKSK